MGDMDFDHLWDYQRPDETERRFREVLPAVPMHSSQHVELLTQIARAQGLQRRFAEAHATLDEAQRLLSDDLARVRYLLERGRVLNSSGQPDRARPLFLEAWDQARAAGEDYHAVDAAHMLGIVEPPAAQLDWNLKALALAERSPNGRARKWLASLYNNIGWTYHDRGDYERALSMFQRALERRLEEGQAAAIRTARWCVGRALRSLGRLEEALELQRALLADFEGAGERGGYVFEELGECLACLGRSEEARPYFQAAYDELHADPWLAEREPARLARLKALGEAG